MHKIVVHENPSRSIGSEILRPAHLLPTTSSLSIAVCQILNCKCFFFFFNSIASGNFGQRSLMFSYG